MNRGYRMGDAYAEPVPALSFRRRLNYESTYAPLILNTCQNEMHSMKKSPKEPGRICKCGFVFEYFQKRKFNSFAVVNDKDYQRFLRAENRVSRAVDETEKLRAMGRSARFVGSMLECPECGRLLLIMPNAASSAYYSKEE